MGPGFGKKCPSETFCTAEGGCATHNVPGRNISICIEAPARKPAGRKSIDGCACPERSRRVSARKRDDIHSRKPALAGGGWHGQASRPEAKRGRLSVRDYFRCAFIKEKITRTKLNSPALAESCPCHPFLCPKPWTLNPFYHLKLTGFHPHVFRRN